MERSVDDQRKIEIEMIRDAIGGAETAIEIIEEFFINPTPPWKDEEIAFHHIHDHLNWAVHEMIKQLKTRGYE